MVARRAHNPEVAGSSPAPATKLIHMERLRHESNHAFGMAQWRGIDKKKRLKVLTRPDKVEQDGEHHYHYSFLTRTIIVAVIIVGTGTLVGPNLPILGAVGGFATIVTYFYKRK